MRVVRIRGVSRLKLAKEGAEFERTVSDCVFLN